MSRTQLQPLQLNSLPRAHEHDEYTARPGNRSLPSWNTVQAKSQQQPPSPIIDSTPGLPLGLSRPLNQAEQEKLAQLDRLKFFLATAPSRWDTSGQDDSSSSSDPYLHNMGMSTMNSSHHHSLSHPALNRFLLSSQEYVTCVLWNGLYHITGTDIVRALVFRFEAFGRPVRNMKKFEEGVFSDLRNLKPGQDASLEEPKSPFLDLLFKYQCIRTQKKQKVFYWFSVPHDRLFLDALERDLKREKMGLEPTTQVVGEPAISFIYDGAFKRSLYEQFVKAAGGKDGEGELERAVRGLDEGLNGNELEGGGPTSDADTDVSGDESVNPSDGESARARKSKAGSVGAPAANNPNSPFFNMFSLFEGSPTYKQRRKKTTRPSALANSSTPGMMGDGMEMASDEMRGRYQVRTVNGPSSSSVDRYAYPSGEQYASYHPGSSYDARSSMVYHPISSPPGTTRFPHPHHTYTMDAGYGHGNYGIGDQSTVRVKQEPVSAADMFIRQTQVGLPNADIRMKRPSYPGAGIDTTSVPVWLERAGSAATSTASPYCNRGKSLDDSMTSANSSPYLQAQNLPAGSSPYIGAGSMSRSPSQSIGPSPPGSRGSPHSTSASPPAALAESSAAFTNPISIPSTSPSGTPTTIKAYACPLLSCGRLFKRMEHLKRHLRTHTLERPFVCTREGCGKRFSRSDNLGQHSRVCRGGKPDASSSSNDEGGEKTANCDGDSLGLSGMEWGVNVGEWINSEMDEEQLGDTQRGDAEMGDEQPTANIGVGLNMFGGSNGLGMGMGMSAGVSGAAVAEAYASGAPLDVPMELCEVELTGDVRDVHGDEEGLVRVHVRGESGDENYPTAGSSYPSEPQQPLEAYNQQQHQFYDSTGYLMNHPHPHHHSSLDSHLLQSNTRHLRATSPRQSLDSQLDAQQWAMRGTPSPAFGTIAIPNGHSSNANRNSWNGMGGSLPKSQSYLRQHSNGSDHGYGGDDSSIYSGGSASLPIPGMNSVSVSAPSHKLAFDHANLYPQGMLLESSTSFSGSMGSFSGDASTSGGPVRRHRSMTPSLMRDGGFVRRPGTSGSSPGDNMVGVTTGYHPYASSSSRASSLSRGGGSLHSSPAGHQLPLPGMGMQRSESRASNLSVEVSGSEHLHQTRQMMSRPGSADPHATSNSGYQGEMYRTESPAPFAHHLSSQVTDSPGTFVMDLPAPSYHQASHLHSATVPAQFGMSGMEEHFAQGMHGGNGGYYPHHVSTI